MRLEGRKLIADDGYVLDFAEPKYALDEDNVPTRIRLYVPFITLGRMDKPENYIEIPENEIEKDSEKG